MGIPKNPYKLLSVHEGSSLFSNDPSRKLIRQVLGVFSKYEKRMIAQKLRVSRERIRKINGKCEGRKSYHEVDHELSKVVRKLRKKRRCKDSCLAE